MTQAWHSAPEGTADASTGIPAGLREFEALTPSQKAELTKKAQRRAVGFRVGERVRTNTPRSPKFHNRVGTVSTTNLGEVGVGFTGIRPDGRADTEAWFRPAELVKERP